jgi:hypothetical protein
MNYFVAKIHLKQPVAYMDRFDSNVSSGVHEDMSSSRYTALAVLTGTYLGCSFRKGLSSTVLLK